MTTVPMPAPTALAPAKTGSKGPLTRHRQRRAAAVYGCLFVAGLLLLILSSSAGWRSFGVGLWYPGAGFLVAGGWPIVLLPVTLLLFGVSLIAWFGAGGSSFPVLVWLLSAIGAALLAGSDIWDPGPYVAGGLLLLFVGNNVAKGRAKAKTRSALRLDRQEYLPEALVSTRAQLSAPIPAENSGREMTPKQLAALRYSLDKALQPVGDLSGFDKKDQFQTSALRYQLNQLGYSIAVAQSRYAPSFHGYLSLAQRRILEQYVQRPIWHYWRYENAWGNLRWDADPATRDNIMLTGYVGINLALYTLNTGDRRYTEPGSMPFRLNGRKTYPHSMTSIVQSVVDNFRRQAFCLYPCEPNWIYSGCNFRGLTTIAAYDAAMGTDYFNEIKDNFRFRLEQEFINEDGGVVALRSALTGLAVPFPVSDANLPVPLNVLFPDLAERYWTYVRHDLLDTSNGSLTLKLPAKTPVDFGNYKQGWGFVIEPLVGASRELGDAAVTEVAEQALDDLCEPVYEDGVLRFQKASNLSNASIDMSLLLHRDYWRDTIHRGPAKEVFTGPILDEMSYPAVLVARTDTDGHDLRLVLYPGQEPGPTSVEIRRLRPNAAYTLTGALESRITAGPDGSASVPVVLDGRTTLQIAPAN